MGDVSFEQIPREDNCEADSLARLASSTKAEHPRIIPLIYVRGRSVGESKVEVLDKESRASWMQPIRKYLET